MHTYPKNPHLKPNQPNNRKPCSFNPTTNSFFLTKSGKTHHEYQSQYNEWGLLRSKFKNLKINLLQTDEQPVGKNYKNKNSDGRKQKQYIKNRTLNKSIERPFTGRKLSKQFQINPEELGGKAKFRPYKSSQKMKRKVFQNSLNDLKRIKCLNILGQKQILERKVMVRKSLIIDKNMHAIQVSLFQKGLLFIWETMGEKFDTKKLAIGPEELNAYKIYFSAHSFQQISEKLVEYLFLEGGNLKLDRCRMEKQKGKIILQRQLEIIEKSEFASGEQKLDKDIKWII